MARVTHFSEQPDEVSTRTHSEVECGYRVVSNGAETFVQLDTYGSNDRQIPGKVSQSLQFDRVKARELVQIFQKVFPGV